MSHTAAPTEGRDATGRQTAPAGVATDATVEELIEEEIRQAGRPAGRWHAEYLGRAHHALVEAVLRSVKTPGPRVLKTDLWNECLGGTRDVLGNLDPQGGHRLFALDRSLAVCLRSRARVPGVRVVQADIAALPFRPRSFDAVLDLSTLDHVTEADSSRAIGEYRRVLRDRGVLLLLFWQRNLAVRLRVALKRLLKRREKPDQRYFTRAAVRADVADGFAIRHEFATGLLLLPPHRHTGTLLSLLPVGRMQRLVQRLVGLELSGRGRRWLVHFAGLYGIVAIRR
ncbi:MAG TPA: class I SAM-dependent methyltransferase [Thermoanaerobaculaceae bacterium]|nr:class I SAM-dependent methyltransferase [Thermoanaerobaculaceae bacterium]